ncbi:MAG: hypothetical protein OXI81_18930 [Paracoccaceae bacterium]|nr:hypothetical protein [Paracoccaceae bacterium]
MTEDREPVTALQGKTVESASGCLTRIRQCEQILLSIHDGVDSTRRWFGFWGLMVAFLLLLGALDEILILLGLLGLEFG